MDYENIFVSCHDHRSFGCDCRPRCALRSPQSKKLSDGAQFTVDGGTLRIQFWSPEIVRVTYAATNELPSLKSLSVVASPESVRLKREENDQAFTLSSPDIKVRIDKQTGAVSFLDLSDHVLLQESTQGRKITPATVAGAAVTSCAQTFDLATDEGIYGLGQHQRGVWNYTSWRKRAGSLRPTRTWAFR